MKPAPAGERQAPALRARLLRRLLPPLVLGCIASSAAVWFVGRHFASAGFDRALLGDAYTVAANVQSRSDGGVNLTMSPGEVSSVLIDPAERVVFAVADESGRIVAGDPALQVPAVLPGQRFRFSEIDYGGRRMRAISLRHDGVPPFRVLIAQTTRARASLLWDLVLASLLPQLLLFACLAAWLRQGVQRELQPLEELRSSLARRHAQALDPLPVLQGSREVLALGEAINALLARLAHSLQAQREFAGNVAHEMRTPLAGIRALADYALAKRSPEVMEQQLQQIAASQARASRLVDQLLALAIAEEARTGMRLEPLRLDELAQSVVIRNLGRADAKGVDLGGEGLDRAVTIEGDAALIEGMLDNLVDNALRYGGRSITLRLDGLELSVIDDGPGMPEAEREGALARWAQGADGKRLAQGSGLGLAIVARYAQQLGATLRLDPASEAGGLAVRIAFPPPSAPAQGSAG